MDRVKTISQSTFGHKYIVPILAIILTSWIFYKGNEIAADLTWTATMILFGSIGIVALYMHFRELWPIIDKVADTGSSLIFTRYGKKVEIQYSQIENFVIHEEKGGDSYSVNVDLKINTDLGDTLTFFAAVERDVHIKPIERIYQIEKIIHKTNKEKQYRFTETRQTASGELTTEQVDLKIKKHPTYVKKQWRLWKMFIVTFIALYIAGHLFHNNGLEILHDFSVIAGFVAMICFVFALGRLNRKEACPECGRKIKLGGHLENDNSSMACIDCKILWDLGVGASDD